MSDLPDPASVADVSAPDAPDAQAAAGHAEAVDRPDETLRAEPVAQPADPDDGAIEEVDALPVLAGGVELAGDQRGGFQLSGAPPAVQVAAVAASGFVAGAAIVGLVHRRRRRRSLAARHASRRRHPDRSGPIGELVQIVGTRSVLVDVHLLGGRG